MNKNRALVPRAAFLPLNDEPLLFKKFLSLHFTCLGGMGLLFLATPPATPSPSIGFGIGDESRDVVATADLPCQCYLLINGSYKIGKAQSIPPLAPVKSFAVIRHACSGFCILPIANLVLDDQCPGRSFRTRLS
jgi:hypothetical protein